jgi:hypothetical protein
MLYGSNFSSLRIWIFLIDYEFILEETEKSG